jgi:hypothetical protein
MKRRDFITLLCGGGLLHREIQKVLERWDLFEAGFS